MGFRTIHGAIRLGVATVTLALVLRTWFVIGLIAPVTVSGSSMAPALVGPHYAVRCPVCEAVVRVSADSVPNTGQLVCPYCEDSQIHIAGTRRQYGTRLWIDRTAYQWREPRRWEVVVFRGLGNDHRQGGSQLCTKRVVGLPGEQVELADGDVVIDGHVQTKSLAEQRALRQFVKRGQNYLSLPCEESSREKSSQKKSPCEKSVLTPLFRAKGPFTDDLVYNARLSRRLNWVRDFMLSAKAVCEGDGQIVLGVDNGLQKLRLEICPTDGLFRLTQRGQQVAAGRISPASRRRFAHGEVLLELSTFDRQLLLALDGKVELRHALVGDTAPAKQNAGTTEPFAVGTIDLRVTLREVALWRDIYYGTRPVGTAPSDRLASWQLAADELFLLGDNAPVSADSRIWPHPGLPLRRLVGRPLGVR